MKEHGKFHSAKGKRLVMIVDDEFVNRELLRVALQNDYDLIYAENGEEALEKMHEHADDLTLVLLDLVMPVLDGTELLKRAKADLELAPIPIIVLTANQDAEVESLTLGASDFIPKPYPQPSVMLARINKTIELTETRQIVNSTERDTLTGLYNREYFYRYAEQYDQHHKDVDMDAIVVDVNHFHMINERFGTTRGDEVLRRIGMALRDEVNGIDGIVCRREADIFLVYCPHGLDYAALLESVTAKVSGESGPLGAGTGMGDIHVWLRMGVYERVDKGMEVERRFDRAKMAADRVQGSFATPIGIYDDELRERELYQEQLIEDFDAAIRERQFQVYFQPKFDIKPDIPVLASAESLVRWIHPELGMVSPGSFVPLFEDNGLIQSLDTYVWRETAARIREWRERFDFAVPVSVNVSRIDMYDPHLVDTLLEILVENGLTPHDLLLEITESAYTHESEQIIATVNKLRRLGFRIEMDDFGSGYSSLNMISTLPIDALKMDMEFIRNAFSEEGDTKMLEVVIDIADYLSIPVIAEGVETQEQMDALRLMGCDYVQGYYFSKPVPAPEYERFVIERKQVEDARQASLAEAGLYESGHDLRPFENITHALSGGFERIYYVDTESDHYVEFSSKGEQNDLQIERSGSDFFGDELRRLVNSVCPEDSMRVELSLRKDALLAQLVGTAPFFIAYRVVERGAPVFYSLEAARALTHDDHHVVMGIRNVDAQIHETDADELLSELSFSKFAQALACDAAELYYIDADTGAYEHFDVHGFGHEVVRTSSGEDFFAVMEDAYGDAGGPDAGGRDADDGDASGLDASGREQWREAAALFDRQALINALSQQPAFLVTRTYVDADASAEAEGAPARRQVTLKATWADRASRRHIVVSVADFAHGASRKVTS